MPNQDIQMSKLMRKIIKPILMIIIIIIIIMNLKYIYLSINCPSSACNSSREADEIDNQANHDDDAIFSLGHAEFRKEYQAAVSGINFAPFSTPKYKQLGALPKNIYKS